MKRQARECYLVRLQRYGEDPETIMGSWHPDFRELMKRLRDRQLTLMARLTVLEVDAAKKRISLTMRNQEKAGSKNSAGLISKA